VSRRPHTTDFDKECGSKRPYAKRADAFTHLAQLVHAVRAGTAANFTSRDAERMTVYKCRFCKRFHIGHRSARRPATTA
jgi:hypothetical protein